MLTVLGILLVIAIICIPQFWVKRIIKKYHEPIPQLPGNGGELALHLVKRFGLSEVQVQQSERDEDYYDPENKVICLSEANYETKSISAVTIAAHEFGHALQHHLNYKPLLLRTRLAKVAVVAEKIAAFILVSLPFSVVLVKIPLVSLIMLLSGITIMCLPIVLHMVTLPVEFDASFKRALPVLQEGNYLPESALPIAKRILTAAALTYFAASLISLLDFYRWFRVLRH